VHWDKIERYEISTKFRNIWSDTSNLAVETHREHCVLITLVYSERKANLQNREAAKELLLTQTWVDI
jgi:hypothetical protein